MGYLTSRGFLRGGTLRVAYTMRVSGCVKGDSEEGARLQLQSVFLVSNRRRRRHFGGPPSDVSEETPTTQKTGGPSGPKVPSNTCQQMSPPLRE
jgi:hypothetical protein